MSRRGLPEAEARWFFQQLMTAVDYCHRKGALGGLLGVPGLPARSGGRRAQPPVPRLCPCRGRASLRRAAGVAGRRIKLQNMLVLESGPKPLLKLCDFHLLVCTIWGQVGVCGRWGKTAGTAR